MSPFKSTVTSIHVYVVGKEEQAYEYFENIWLDQEWNPGPLQL